MDSPRLICAMAPWMDMDLRQALSARAAELGFEIRWFENEDDALEDAKTCEILYGLAPRCLRAARQLKWFCIPFAGVDRFTAPGLVPEGTLVTHSAGAYGPAIAEHVVMVSLMLLRREDRIFPRMENRLWQKETQMDSLEGRSIVVLGTGDLGKTCARRLRAFAPRALVGVSRSGRDARPDFDRVFPASEAEKALPQAELLVMTLPGTEETENFLSEERMDLLPRGAYVVNVGRGRCLDEKALRARLKDGRIAGAALDVMRHEPLPPDDPLWETPNLLLTPHCAGDMTVRGTRVRCADIFQEDLDNYASGRTLKHLVDLKRGY